MFFCSSYRRKDHSPDKTRSTEIVKIHFAEDHRKNWEKIGKIKQKLFTVENWGKKFFKNWLKVQKID